MKKLSVEDIIQRRKTTLPKTAQPQQRPPSPSLIDKQLKEIDDNAIDGIINAAVNRSNLTQEQRSDILQVLTQKTGFSLSRQLTLPLLKVRHFPAVVEICSQWHKSTISYFVMRGQLILYQIRETNSPAKFNTQPSFRRQSRDYIAEDEQASYGSLQQFQRHYRQYERKQQYGQYRCIGSLFRKGKGELKQGVKYKLVAVGAVVVSFPNMQSQATIGDGTTLEAKAQQLSRFPVLQLIGKRLSSFISSFKLKKYTLKEIIFKNGEIPKSVYFVVKGEVRLEIVLEGLEAAHRHLLSTQTVGPYTFFGQEEIIIKSQRIQSARVVSSPCIVLQLQRQKFQKLLENAEFRQIITKSAAERGKQRQQKIAKAIQIITSQNQRRNAKNASKLSDHQIKQLTWAESNDNKKRISNRRQSQTATRVMHGNIIRDIPVDNQDIQFSMLGINPDHLNSVQKKYRRYSVKPLHYDPYQPRDFKKLWKLFNLQQVLREQQIQLSDPSGRKFFDTHRRLTNYVRQSRSLRPKTSGSNYRTKMQYLAYLQQFNK